MVIPKQGNSTNSKYDTNKETKTPQKTSHRMAAVLKENISDIKVKGEVFSFLIAL